MLAIALTKGRLEKQTIDLLESMGYGVDDVKNKGRQLVFNDAKKDVKYFLVKSADSITYVVNGVADVGVVGKDTILESSGEFYEVMDLGLGKCKFILASLPNMNPLEKIGHIRIGTKYPTVAKNYFQKMGKDVEIIKIEGSVELGPIIGLCDGIIDITETGTTLRENGLVIYDTLDEISARVIVNTASFKLKRNEIKALLNDLKEALEDVAVNEG